MDKWRPILKIFAPKRENMGFLFCFILINLGLIGAFFAGKSNGFDSRNEEVLQLKSMVQKNYQWLTYYRKALSYIPKLYWLVPQDSEASNLQENGADVRNAMLTAASKGDETGEKPPFLQ